jgi:hypothetical protein
MKGFRDMARGFHKNWFLGKRSPSLRLMSFLLLSFGSFLFPFKKKKRNK